jgi:O-antigen/teichoic acid export membrane protein
MKPLSRPASITKVDLPGACPNFGSFFMATPTGEIAPSSQPPLGSASGSVIGRLLRGTFWLALRTPLQALFALWTVPLLFSTVGETLYGAYGFAWGFGFVQFLFEFGMSSALSRQVSDAWTRGDRPAVDRTVRCGIAFYALMAVVQAATLLLVAAWGIPDSWDPAARRLIMQLLWLQALTAPCYGASVVLSSLLQAARRYEFVPRYELLIIILRFLVLLVGLKLGLDFFLVIVIQTLVQVILGLGPALYVTIRELRYVPLPGRVAWSDYRSLWNLSLAVFLIQLSVVLADKLDTTILGYALDDPAPAVATYQAVSKPFLQIRQMGWMLAYLVMPAVASLAAARDLVALDRIAYDGTRSLVALLAPVTLLAAIYAEPFLAAWLPQVVSQAWLMQLFLVAALPLVLSVLVQASIGIGHVWPIAIAAFAGSLVNLPLSFVLTRYLGVSGVIWGTVLTTLVSNGLAPGIYVFRRLELRPAQFLSRSLAAPLVASAALIAAALFARSRFSADPVGPSLLERFGPLAIHVGICCLIYLLAYAATSVGRRDVAALLARLGPRRFEKPASESVPWPASNQGT